MRCHGPVPRSNRYLLEAERKLRSALPLPHEVGQLLSSSGKRSDLGWEGNDLTRRIICVFLYNDTPR
jgi:hypothetical protein